MVKMSLQQKYSVPSAVIEMSTSELGDFHISKRVRGSESTESYNRAEEATVNNPENRVADEKTLTSQFALPDELLAKVLGHLPLPDRFRLETVCRQWQRCMYLEVERLHLNFHSPVDQQYTLRIKNGDRDGESVTTCGMEELPVVLQKLTISRVGLLICDIEDEFTDRELFVLLADIASHSTKVVVAYHIFNCPTNFVTFSDIIGPHVTTLLLGWYCWHRLPEDVQPFADSLARMKRLKELGSNWLNLIFNCLNSFPASSLPEFQEIHLACGDECDRKLWEHFKPLYGAQIKKITFHDDSWLDGELEVMLPWRDVAPFANLEHLDFRFIMHICTYAAFIESLEVTSRSCPRLTSLRLTQKGLSHMRFILSLADLRAIFVAIGKMKMLEKLDLELEFVLRYLGDISSRENLDLFALLENKSNITHLKANVKLFNQSAWFTDIPRESYSSLNEAMPNLRHLDVRCMASELDHFVGLEKMQTVILQFHSEYGSERIRNGLIHILRSSPALKSFKVCGWFAEDSKDLFGPIMEVAELQMEKHIDFIAELQALDDAQKAWDAIKDLAPMNLTLIFQATFSHFKETFTHSSSFILDFFFNLLFASSPSSHGEEG